MASTSTNTMSAPVFFTTQTQYPLPSQKYMIPMTWKRYQLSQLINKALSLTTPVPFDFLVKGEVLRASLSEWCAEHGEETLEIEYIESVMPPQKMSDFPHEDWVSSVSCKVKGYFFTASYDGHIRSFDYSKNVVSTTQVHAAPITSFCTVPKSDDSNPSTYLIATASHDLTGQLTEITLDSSTKAKPLASLHLHTAPISSIASNAAGSHLLTSSWDSLVCLWDTTVPSSDEVPEEINERDRKKRRRIEEESKPKRKAPLIVLKSHTNRVSKVVFGSGTEAYSCGFDSTVRVWNTENGLCTRTISASEKPFLNLAAILEGGILLATSTDRTMTMYDLRVEGLGTTAGSFMHPATPSCIAVGTAGSQQVVTGAYDGVVRLWDLRSTKNAMASFKAWDGTQKVLSVDWQSGIVGVGGEGGLEVWKVGEERV
ncbi:ribosome biogenesis protein YTM1 [Collybia nuda]|uniref:Ribosome biogenesis protein YTM1 n=1 Tax=Collybia nuda TaxID=64659 RepID=A0A9P5XY87_9AGAR|nr:ribosome biogenesis protein YTM1 [Collybia nuda]